MGMYFYKAKVTRVVDGDTLDIVIDLGFRASMQLRVRLARIREAYRGEILTGALSLKIVFSLPRAKSQKRKYPSHQVGDLDNFLKAFCDAANGLLWEDDRQVIHVDAWKLFAVGKPSIQVSVQEIT